MALILIWRVLLCKDILYLELFYWLVVHIKVISGNCNFRVCGKIKWSTKAYVTYVDSVSWTMRRVLHLAVYKIRRFVATQLWWVKARAMMTNCFTYFGISLVRRHWLHLVSLTVFVSVNLSGHNMWCPVVQD